jgi:hypothetical protein
MRIVRILQPKRVVERMKQLREQIYSTFICAENRLSTLGIIHRAVNKRLTKQPNVQSVASQSRSMFVRKKTSGCAGDHR